MAFPQHLQKREKSFIPNEFNTISLSVASPEEMLSWSYGEVTKPETINYRTQKPERDGLFCERIFGPAKNWECACGKYKKLRFKNIVCDRCGVEVTRASVRRERMAHIKLAVPVSHIWYLRSTPSRLGLLLDLPVKTLEQVVYFASYIIQEVDEEQKAQTLKQLDQEYKALAKKLREEYQAETGNSPDASKKAVVSDDEPAEVVAPKKKGAAQAAHDAEVAKDPVRESFDAKLTALTEQFERNKDDVRSINRYAVISELKYRDLSMKFGHLFRAGIGAEAIREILEKMDLEPLAEEMRAELAASSGQKRKKIVRRLMLIGAMATAGIRPEWMVLTILPVIPPDLRPMVQLDGGRFAASDLNDLYRRIINRNNRLKRLLEIGAPEVICRNEKRMLQEAVDALINNSARQTRAVTKTGSNQLQLKSLSDMLKGKQGRFRANLLGKRVDYSGRSVIVVGPSLRLHECGLPKKMALELFKPFVIGQLLKREVAHNIKNAEKLIDQGIPEVWDVLEEVIRGHYVLLNRAPTLHRLGIQAFQPILIEGKAIQIHPLVCAAFNADFDGDQMAVHVPLSAAAQKEAREIMASTLNLLKPSSGEAITTAQQDMVLGCYYLTMSHMDIPATSFAFVNINEAITAYRTLNISLQDRFQFRLEKDDGTTEMVETTVGRLIFNSFLPKELGFVNETMTKKRLEGIVAEAFERTNLATTARLSDEIKRIGFKFATKAGISLATDDFIIPEKKAELVEKANEQVVLFNKQFRKGLITDQERYVHTLRVWSATKNLIADEVVKSADPHGALHVMISSGARGNWGQATQVAGMKGLVVNPAGRTIELPIKANYREGFTVLEYFINMHSGRKGKSDTALKTANAGYLTRRLVDAVQDVIIRDIDCGTTAAIPLTRQESERVGEKFATRIFGRTLAAPVADPKTGEVLAEAGEEISRDHVKLLEAAKVDKIMIRAVLTCLTENGVCVKCYGRDLATNHTVEIGTAVGIIAAQSIGEPGTQLTMKTFHQGGVADTKDITQGLPRVEELFEARSPKTPAVISGVTGIATLSRRDQMTVIEVKADELSTDTYLIGPMMQLLVKDGDEAEAKTSLAKAKDGGVIRAKEPGRIEFTSEGIIIHHRSKLIRKYEVPARETLKIVNGDHVEAGQPLTEGHANLAELMGATSVSTTEKYIVNEVQSIYASQGQSINDKHIEIIVRQMFSKSRILEAGDSIFLPGQVVDSLELRRINEQLVSEGKVPAFAERLLLGLTRVSLSTESWLSAASFQETIRVLVDASVTRRPDQLAGLKENVIIGKLIRAGEHFKENYYRSIGKPELAVRAVVAPEIEVVLAAPVALRSATIKHRISTPKPVLVEAEGKKKAKKDA